MPVWDIRKALRLDQNSLTEINQKGEKTVQKQNSKVSAQITLRKGIYKGKKSQTTKSDHTQKGFKNSWQRQNSALEAEEEDHPRLKNDQKSNQRDRTHLQTSSR